jgi:hypothetical protein
MGVIYGTVASKRGQPGKRILLWAEPLDFGGQLPSTKSNSRGEYRFENLPWGRYTVYAEDNDAGYLRSVEDEGQPSIKISPEHPRAEFPVVLPARAGVLQIRLTNRKTGTEIPWMFVTVADPEQQRRRSPRAYACESSNLILVPPDTNLILHIEADGFREWEESALAGKLIFVSSGTRLTLNVQLDPVE